MVKAQEWLDQNYPKEQRSEISELNVGHDYLEGELDLNDFINLKEFSCYDNQLTDLNLTSCINLERVDCRNNQFVNLSLPNYCPNLATLYCSNNQLTKLDFSTLNPKKLKELNITNNNFSESDLSIFSCFTNLEVLSIGTHETSHLYISDNWEEQIKKSIYNRFYDSLESLKNLTKLRELDISNTDVNSGYEYLPTSIERVYCFNKERPESKVKEIYEQLKWISKSISGQKLKEWIDFGFSSKDYGFATYLIRKDYHPWPYLDLEKLREAYNKSAQGWLDKNFSQEERKEMMGIWLDDPSLEGELDFSDFIYRYLKIYIFPWVDETKLTFKNLPGCASPKYAVVLTDPEKYLQKKYPTQEGRIKVEELYTSDSKLVGDLDLSGFANLKKLYCEIHKLTSLNLSNCHQLMTVRCHNLLTTDLDVSNCSQLTDLFFFYNDLLSNIILPNNPINLKNLDLRNNNFPVQDLSFLVPCINLETLSLGNDYKKKINQGIYNRFTGSLDYLSGMKKLKSLNISNTDLNEVDINKLSKNLEVIAYSTELRPDCRLTEIVSQLEEYGGYGRCQKCRQPNTSRKWCQFCAEQEWKQLNGWELVNKFIEQQKARKHQKGVGYRNELEFQWIPYKQFTNIEHLATGGFSKVYKAKWYKSKNENDDKKENNFKKEVVLKVLSNSQNITSDFLTEITNNKLVDGNWLMNTIVECYGFSQDPVTKDYAVVMDYKEEGNLRQFLQNKTNKSSLELKEKLEKLRNIAWGLREIHGQNLIHCDFHSGNVLNDKKDTFVTDFGLCRPANYQKKEGQIFGVLPYIAPEVLRGKPYTQKSDIYSFGFIAYEFFANEYPYPKMDETDLTLKVCWGLRPNIEELKIPQLLKDLIKQCWDADPEKRPNSRDVGNKFFDWGKEVQNKSDTLFYQQLEAVKEEYDYWSQNTPYKIYPTATLTSKMVNTDEINSKLIGEDLESLRITDSIKPNQEQNNWINISPNFVEELTQNWQNLNFTFQQTQDWINIGLQPTDHNFCAWLRDIKNLTPEQVLNHYNLEELNQEFFACWQGQQKNQIEQLPK